MELLNKVCSAVGISVLVLTVIGTVGIMTIDALEYETTGSCVDCVLLDKIRNLD